ncbi:MAG TPA: single-stranded-DNA-specific exonuclease RecJ, partial [Candidatus Angelobacter sp.]|nr:single-stranded-DNA-specific exonuclease RecJ [Candidatus Angelobacter sp.]
AADLVPEARIDAELQLHQITPNFLEEIARLEPFGQSNPEPVFASRGVNLLMPPKVLKEKHLKLLVKQRTAGDRASFNYEAIGWRMAERLQQETYQPGELIDLAFTVGLNHHPDFGGIQLTLEDFHRAANSVCSPVAGVV